ncbi:MAG: ABC transporter ATP-binding protein, partial [Actinobacteria bacterium]|nr:ABC transporter ATP-binding protein [Actinomycetota bacterium]
MKRLDIEIEKARTALAQSDLSDEWSLPRPSPAGQAGPATGAGPLYRLDGVHKLFTRRGARVAALDGVDLTIKNGEFVIVMGSTGSGKSTLLMLLGALDRPSAGALSCEGQDLSRLGESGLCAVRGRLVGFVFQSFNLIPTLTAVENVETALVPLGVSAGERRDRALAALADVGLSRRAGHVPGELSGGEQQRVAIARALVKDPHVLLADEPTGNLDEKTRDDIVGVLESVWRERGKTLIVVTHDTAVAARAPRLIRLHEGRVVEDV